MADIVVRPAREDEWTAAGAITVAAYQADRHIDSHTGGYADTLVDARTRAREAELLVAVDAENTVLGTVTVGMLLRAATGGGIQFSFVLVAATVLALFLLGWRLLDARPRDGWVKVEVGP